MMMNVGGVHWSTAVVDTTTIHISIMDSLSPSMPAVSKAIERVKMFAAAMDGARGDDEQRWAVSLDDVYQQKDCHSCGPYAVGHAICAELGVMLDVSMSGDVIRVAIVYSSLRRGEVYEKERDSLQSKRHALPQEG